MENKCFDLYGIIAELDTPLWLSKALDRDFSYFTAAKGAAPATLTLKVMEQEAPFDRIPKVKACLYQPDSVSYEVQGVRYVDYFGKALSIYDYKLEKGELYSQDKALLHELSYLILLSRVGEMLDKNGVHRVHSMGFSLDGKGVLCLMPQGGGKTTLCLEMLKGDKFKLLSDDTPLITRGAQLLPFPLRIGVSEGAKLDISQEYLGSMDRRKHGKKILIDIRYYAGKISGPVPVEMIISCERVYSDKPEIVEASKLTVFSALFRDCIAGLGLPQMVEYFLRSDPKDLLSKTGIVVSRTLTCAKAVLKAKTYTLKLGTDTARNAAALMEFASRK